MQRCLDLAQKGLGETYPNPMVGAVIVFKNQIIGEGWHQKAGLAHAEVNAINSVSDKALLSKSTLYVNLEPCSHFGKTPPCVQIIKKFKIPRIVIGSIDPNPKVAGKGIKALKNFGCKVIQGVLKKDTDFLNRRFFTFHQKKRPYIILKWAQTSDHFIAPFKSQNDNGTIFWITNNQSRQTVHQWRGQEAAILVGVQTIIEDNPKLTTRNFEGSDPLRLVLDPHSRIPKESNVNKDKKPAYFFNKVSTSKNINQKRFIKLDPFNLNTFLNYCFKNHIQSIIVEGGKKTLQNFIDTNLWDESRIFTAKKKLNKGVTSPKFDSKSQIVKNFDGDELNFYFN